MNQYKKLQSEQGAHEGIFFYSNCLRDPYSSEKMIQNINITSSNHCNLYNDNSNSTNGYGLFNYQNSIKPLSIVDIHDINYIQEHFLTDKKIFN